MVREKETRDTNRVRRSRHNTSRGYKDTEDLIKNRAYTRESWLFERRRRGEDEERYSRVAVMAPYVIVTAVATAPALLVNL